MSRASLYSKHSSTQDVSRVFPAYDTTFPIVYSLFLDPYRGSLVSSFDKCYLGEHHLITGTHYKRHICVRTSLSPPPHLSIMSPTALSNGSSTVNHPLDPLTPEEITAVSFVVRQHIATETSIKAIKFITCYLLPPPKKAVLAFLGIPLTPGGKPENPTEIIRKAEVDFLDVVNGYSYNSILSLKDGVWTVDTLDKLAEGIQPQISVEELIACEEVVRKDERIRKLAKDVGVLPEQIHADGWAIGYDERFPQCRRVQQAFLFARFSEHENLYAHPLDFIPVIDSNSDKVLHIDFPPIYKTSSKGIPKLSVESTEPGPLSYDSISGLGRDRIPPPPRAFNFLPDLMAKTEDFKPREDVKALHVVQPEGVSFKMNGHELVWQKWKMHIGIHFISIFSRE